MFLTDYPDAALIKNLEHNVERNIPQQLSPNVHVMVGRLPVQTDGILTLSQGYIWGRSLQPIFDVEKCPADEGLFDLVIMSDLVFNHSQVSMFHARAEFS